MHSLFSPLKYNPHPKNHLMNNISTTYLVFLTSNGEKQIVSIESLIYSGHPIDSETGDDLELFSNDLVDCNGNCI